MPSLLMRALLLYATVTSIHALALAPKATTTAIFKTTAAALALRNALHNDYGPRPTAPPAFHQLFGRQGVGDVEYIVAPDNTCGYIGSKKEDELEVVCIDPVTRRCVMLRNVALTSGIVACCDGTSCKVTTQCVPYSQISAGNCDAMCMGNNNALICLADF
ncbi:hypothetical protein MAPG_00022 [Magnaporthiopsis poae ATCC 64411]|uniref:Uncharacterized protein n=1 Tax=Magnaporthiopsis poae (strain ATCC 64411 / 73-15) TaxID=644358 RepID=A0A0C4DJW3_MAGP6|nr:hypothetical protein MAPG_00022 [Magnaporthiopsis poae ATCC 64411]